MTPDSNIFSSIKDIIVPLGEILGALIFGVVVGVFGVVKKRKMNIKNIFLKEENISRVHDRVHELLTEMRLTVRSSRCLIFQFHNGGVFTDGSSIKRFSVTYESFSAGIETMVLGSQDVLVTRYMELIGILRNQPSKIISVESLPECLFRSSLGINNVVYFSISPLKGIDDLTPMGFVCCQWCSEEDFDSIREDKITDNMVESIIENTTHTINEHLVFKREKNK